MANLGPDTLLLGWSGEEWEEEEEKEREEDGVASAHLAWYY